MCRASHHASRFASHLTAHVTSQVTSQVTSHLTACGILIVVFALQLGALQLGAQQVGVQQVAALRSTVSSADSALIARLLLAEERRDTSAATYADGVRSTDARIRTIARRALGRSRDALFARRDSLPALPAPPAYTDPAWRLRYRALGARNDKCDDLRTALADSSWQVRLRAADLITPSCGNDAAIVATLRNWTNTAPTTSVRAKGGVSWHAMAHGLTALARIAPADARAVLPRAVASRIATLRAYAARAATTLSDTATLRRLAADSDDNVKETAIGGLARVAGHSADDVFLAALAGRGNPVIRAAASALKESPRGDAVLAAAITAAQRLQRDSSETARRVRAAVAERVGEFAKAGDWPRVAPLAADYDCAIARAYSAIGTTLGVAGAAARCTPMPIALPADAVRLALGADVRLRMVMADSSGGGTFVVRLRGDNAPVMAARVLALVRSGWYNGNTWHRVEPDFVIQGAAAGANEFRGFPRFFRDELGIVPHARGTIGMSTGEHDTGDSQWFVNLRDNFRLNRDYTVFAEITEGIETADGVLEGDVIARIEVIR